MFGITIPLQLQNTDYKFCKLQTMGKIPIVKAWQKNALQYDDTKLEHHMHNGGNYGIICGHGDLVVVDYDDINLQNATIDKLPNTFTVRSGRGLLHLYYKCNHTKTFKVMTDDKTVLADIQGMNRIIVGPNCIHDSGNRYTVINDTTINNVEYKLLKEVFSPYGITTRTTKIPQSIIINNHNIPEIDTIKSKVSIKTILDMYGINTHNNPTACPFHASKNSRCFSYSDRLYNCFHCMQTGDVIALVMALRKVTFNDALSILRVLADIPEPVKVSVTKPVVPKVVVPKIKII